MTIIEAIKQVLNMADTGHTSRQIYDLIIENHMIDFCLTSKNAEKY